MINMYTKQEIIIQHYRLGKSRRQISRELGISRRTVKRYVEEHELLQQVNKPFSFQPTGSTNRICLFWGCDDMWL